MGTQTEKTNRKPSWLNKRINIAENIHMKKLFSQASLHTICEEALCPNISECFCKRHASFLILGTICTRGCQFCNVTHNTPRQPDPDEPENLARTIVTLNLKHVVITSPTRDDLDDGGASHFTACIQKVRSINPSTTIETLIPDYNGNRASLELTLDAAPDILSHNLETVERLYDIRRGADYHRSLDVLRTAAEYAPHIPIKSGIMVGLGETQSEVYTLFDDLLEAGCRLLSIGQYLSPRNSNYPVQEYVRPDIFEEYRKRAISAGFVHVESAPYVRSSYNAEKYLNT